MVDLSKVKTIADLDRVLADDDSHLYDDSPCSYDESDIKLNPDLTPAEVEDAMFWARYSRGVMLVSGPPGAGKGLTAISIAWKMRHYFGKHIMLDYRPRRAFGQYHPFDQYVLAEQMSRMSAVAEGKMDDEALARQWVVKEGLVFMQNGVVVLDEFKRYFDRRRPHRPMLLVLSQLFDFWRHLDLLVIGIAVDPRELDQYRCIPKLTTEVRCQWLSGATIQKYGLWPLSTRADIYPLRYIGTAGEGVLEVTGVKQTMVVQGGMPRARLGGLRWVDLYNSKDAKVMPMPKSLTKGKGKGQ